MSVLHVDEEGLFVALALVPGFASRNRYPDLYETKAGKRARMRARRLRAFLATAVDADAAAASLIDGKLAATLTRHAPRSAWTLHGDALDAAVCRYLLERGGGESLGQKQLLAALPNESASRMHAALEAMQRMMALR